MKIEIPKGYEIDEVTTTEIILKKIEPKLPKSWEDLGNLKGFYIDNNSQIDDADCYSQYITNKNIFKTKEQAEASIALAQLSQLMAVYNEGWEPDWVNDEAIYTIFFVNNSIILDKTYCKQRFLNFKDEGTADLFLENFRDLIYQARPLL